ncbi:uncharacterized protein LOC143294992 [Babylonia areolata]|uniref:uncharacterized protein LOC143294992 n=1 Tax=Babylonia areolata TaxID=304850 RepID=UPI003FD1E12A
MTHNLTLGGGRGGGAQDEDGGMATPGMETLLNGSDEVRTGEEVEEATGPLITLVVPLLMFATGVLGNVVALALLWRSRRDHSRSVFYRLVSGLAATDLLGTLATSPVTLLVYSNDRQWVGGQPVCDYFSFMMIFSGLATVLVVGCLAVERFLAILRPYAYERRVSPERANAVLLVVWVVSAVISCLPLMKVGRNVNHWPGTWCFFDFYSQRAADKVFAFFFALIGLLVIVATALCNVAVVVVLLRMRRITQNIGKSREGRVLNMTSEMQMILFLAGIILVFAACYSPLMVRIILTVTGAVGKDEQWDLLAIRLASVNQILDPWVYLLFRRRLAALLYSACKSVSPLHTLSSLRALRITPELAGDSSLLKGVMSGLRRSPPPTTTTPSSPVVAAAASAAAVSVAAGAGALRRADPPPGVIAEGLGLRGDDAAGEVEEGRKEDSLCEDQHQGPQPSAEHPDGEGDSRQYRGYVVSVEPESGVFGEVVVVQGVVQGGGDGEEGDSAGCSFLLSRDSLSLESSDLANVDSGGGGRRGGGGLRKTSCENPALCLEGDEEGGWVGGEKERRCRQRSVSPNPPLTDAATRAKLSSVLHQPAEHARNKNARNDKRNSLGQPGQAAEEKKKSVGESAPCCALNNNKSRVSSPKNEGFVTGENNNINAHCDDIAGELKEPTDCLNISFRIPFPHSVSTTPREVTTQSLQSPASKLTTSASWPVICRHGNQTLPAAVQSREAERGPDVVNCLPVLKKRHSQIHADCFPLLKNKRHSRMELPCDQCRCFSGQPFSYV